MPQIPIGSFSASGSWPACDPQGAISGLDPGYLLLNSRRTEKCGINDHKLLMGGQLFPMADISPVMSASRHLAD